MILVLELLILYLSAFQLSSLLNLDLSYCTHNNNKWFTGNPSYSLNLGSRDSRIQTVMAVKIYTYISYQVQLRHVAIKRLAVIR